MNWRDELPEGCPGTEGLVKKASLYRVTKHADRLVERDTQSQFQIQGRDIAEPELRCNWRGLSCMGTIEAAKNLLKLPKFNGISVLQIDENGVARQTGRRPHHTFWPSKAFSAKDHMRILKPSS